MSVSQRDAASRLCAAVLTAVLFAVGMPAWGQLTVNGKPLHFDRHTNTYLVSIPEEAFGSDYAARLELEPDSAWTEVRVEGQQVPGTVTFPVVAGGKAYTLQAVRDGVSFQSALRFTFLPILRLRGTFGNDYAPAVVTLSQPEEGAAASMPAKLKWRGHITNTEGKHKRNYHLKFLDADGGKLNRRLFGLRSDNSWILDAGQRDLLRIRNRVATRLWLDMDSRPHYADREPKALNGVRGDWVELFLNDGYEGFYALTEAMDRKQLRLRKYSEEPSVIHGQLWKGTGVHWSQNLFMNRCEDYDNSQEWWGGYDTKYPGLEEVCPTDYQALHDAVWLVFYGSDDAFRQQVGERFDLPVMVDLMTFLMVMNAVDNRGRNLYWACYDREESQRLTPALWDLDLCVGSDLAPTDSRAAEYQPDGHTLETFCSLNRLLERLVALSPQGFAERLHSRYAELRPTLFSTDSLTGRFRSCLDRLGKAGAVSREEQRWSGDTDIDGLPLDLHDEMDYVAGWIARHMDYLDREVFPVSSVPLPVSAASSQAPVYTLCGQRTGDGPLRPGIYVRGGRKVVVR